MLEGLINTLTADHGFLRWGYQNWSVVQDVVSNVLTWTTPLLLAKTHDVWLVIGIQEGIIGSWITSDSVIMFLDSHHHAVKSWTWTCVFGSFSMRMRSICGYRRTTPLSMLNSGIEILTIWIQVDNFAKFGIPAMKLPCCRVGLSTEKNDGYIKAVFDQDLTISDTEATTCRKIVKCHIATRASILSQYVQQFLGLFSLFC